MRKKCPKWDSAIAQPNPTMKTKMKHRNTKLETATVSSSMTSSRAVFWSCLTLRGQE